MADPATDQLEEVQHPTLGPLKFPTSMSLEDRNAAIDHLEKMHGPTSEKEAAQNPMQAPTPTPRTAPMNKVGLFGEQVSPEEEESIKNRAAHVQSHSITPFTNAASIIMPTMGAVENPAGVARGLKVLGSSVAGSGAGTVAGGYGGERVGEMVGHPKEGRTIGAVVGGIAGGYGGYKAATRPPFDPNLPVQAHAEMEQDIANGIQERAGARAEMERDIEKGQGQVAKARGEMEKDFAARAAKTPEAIAEKGLQVGKAKSQLVHGRPFEQLNEQEQSEALMRRGREQRLIDEGAPVEGSSQKPVTVPEPNPVGPGEKPGAQWSVKRRTDLIQNAKRAKEGAGTVLNQLNKPVIYEPRGVVGANPRPGSTVRFGEEPPAAGGSEGTVGNGPIGAKTRSFEPAQTYTKPQFAGAADMPEYDNYVDALIKKGVDRNAAYQIADEDMTLANKPEYFNTTEREASLARMKRIMGPEQRGGARLGPEARGIK